MGRETKQERELWTAHVESRDVARGNKYKAVRTGGFASRHEAACAANLKLLASWGVITNLQYQVPLVLVPGRGKQRSVKYICDFTYLDSDGVKHWLDAKGFKTPTYRLKKRLAALLHGIEIEEV